MEKIPAPLLHAAGPASRALSGSFRLHDEVGRGASGVPVELQRAARGPLDDGDREALDRIRQGADSKLHRVEVPIALVRRAPLAGLAVEDELPALAAGNGP